MKPGDKIRYHDNGAPGGDAPSGLSGTIYTDRVPDQAVGVVTQTDDSLFPVRADFGEVIGEWWLRRGFYSLETPADSAGPWMRALLASAAVAKARISLPCEYPDLTISLGIRYDDDRRREKASAPVEKGVEGAAKALFIQEVMHGRLPSGPGTEILFPNITGFSHPVQPGGGWKAGTMALFQGYGGSPKTWAHRFGAFVDGKMLSLPIQSCGQMFTEEFGDHPWGPRHIEHIVRAGGDVERLADEVIVTLPDTFPLVPCEH